MIKIYVACLASYNSGYLFGKWLDLDNYSSGDEVLTAIEEEITNCPENPMRKIHGEEPEEWAMHDIEGINYELAGRTEWPNFDDLIEMNEVLNDDNGELILEIKDYLSSDIQEAKEFFEEKHIGEFSSDTELADYIAEEINGWDLSEGIGRYFDSQAFARDLQYSGEVTEIGGHYFWAC